MSVDELGAMVEQGVGHQLHASAFKRTLPWTRVARGRLIHDLRHTAAYLWLAPATNILAQKACPSQ